jgi:hypothetical protein
MEFNPIKAIEAVEESPIMIHPRLLDGLRRYKPELSRSLGVLICTDVDIIEDSFSKLSILFNMIRDGEKKT